jgi:hypothetical protein
MPFEEEIEEELKADPEAMAAVDIPPPVIDASLAQAREARDQEIALTNILQGIAQTGAAVASSGRVRPDTSVFDAARKNAMMHADEALKDSLSTRKAMSDRVKAAIAAKNAQSAEQWRKDNFAQRDRAIEATRINKEVERSERKEREARPSDSQVSELTDSENVLKSIDEIEAKKSKFDTGPISGRLHSAAGWVGLQDPEKAAFAASVGENLADYLKSKSGATVSATERAALLKNVPNINDNDDVFNSKLKYLREKITRNRDTMLSNIGKQGKKIEQFKTTPSASSGGSPGFDASAAAAELARRRGKK